MNLLFWGLTIGVIGKMLLAIGILKVHYVMAQERRIDEQVVRSFHLEKIMTLVGVICILAGYILEIAFYNSNNVLTCSLADCAASAFSTLVQ